MWLGGGYEEDQFPVVGNYRVVGILVWRRGYSNEHSSTHDKTYNMVGCPGDNALHGHSLYIGMDGT
jgi:hypothetical protein